MQERVRRGSEHIGELEREEDRRENELQSVQVSRAPSTSSHALLTSLIASGNVLIQICSS